MTPPDPIKIELRVPAEQSSLLEGLEAWLQLGLLTDEQVRRLCREQLVCSLPTPITISPTVTEQITTTESWAPFTAPEEVTPVPNLMTRRFQSLMAEISVLWLLFLGVFMVVVSSAVLAASQWRNFPPIGQYGILFLYTLAFWGVSVWLGRQQRLSLTTRMLQITTLLIIPVNFWMMDGFKLWQNGLGWVIATIAALVLTGINFLLVGINNRLALLNTVGLAWLHWGWGIAGIPLFATYAGTLGTAGLTFYRFERGQGAEAERDRELSLGTVAIAFATLLLIVRAVLVVRIPVSQLGLALGICGWLLCWLSYRNVNREVWRPFGIILLLVGWAVSVRVQIPWQAIAVSGLGMWLLVDQLRRLWQVQAVSLLFVVGLQMMWLLGRIIPASQRQQFINRSIQIVGPIGMPWVLLGVLIFPYVVLTVLFASRLRRRQQPELARHAEILALILGMILTLVSIVNPSMRSLNLLLSAITLAGIIIRRAHPSRFLIYLTHATGLIAVFSCIDLFLPNLSNNAWASILLIATLGEWGLALSRSSLVWRLSAWHLGLVLASLSYVLLIAPVEGSDRGWIWLATPAALTVLAARPAFLDRRLAAWLSVATLILVQALTITAPTPRLFGLGLATGLMLINTRRLQNQVPAILTVGFGLLFSRELIWQSFSNRLTDDIWLNLIAGSTLLLWLLYRWLMGQDTLLNRLYRNALDGWAIAISSIFLLAMTAYTVAIYLGWLNPQLNYASSVGLLTIAIAARTVFQPRNHCFYLAAWSGEILVAIVIKSLNGSSEQLAIANLALGFATQLAGDWQVRRSNQDYRSSWHIIPLLYAALVVGLQHIEFTASTGLYTLGAALVGIGVGRRLEIKLLRYIAIAIVSIAAYELLIYRLLQAKGEYTGDGVLLLAMLGVAIALAYRLLYRWLAPYLRLTLSELDRISDLHWFGSSGLLVLAQITSLSPTGQRFWVGIATILAIYALERGRSQDGAVAEAWTYAGIIEAIAAIGYLAYIFTPTSGVLVEWGAAIAAAIAFGMHTLPWATWGWSPTPWRRSAAILPAMSVLATFWGIALSCLLIVAAFYAWLARVDRVIRLSYLSILLANWALFRLLETQGIQEPLWYACGLGGSLLYLAQVDPFLRSPSEREKRHLLRCLATGLIGATALYQSDLGSQGLEAVVLSLLTIGFGIALILAGLSLRIRAFLYVGTILFIIKVLRQLWLFIDNYSLLLWAIGIVIGLAFIWIAATFEARRSQVTALIQYWLEELAAWD